MTLNCIEQVNSTVQKTLRQQLDVQTRYVLWKTPIDLFAAHVLYHKNCLSGYVLKLKREVELIMRDTDDIEDDCT